MSYMDSLVSLSPANQAGTSSYKGLLISDIAKDPENSSHLRIVDITALYYIGRN